MRSLLAVSAFTAVVQAANPIRKVVTLLQDMRKEIESEADKEKELYEKFMCFCKGNTANLTKAAEDAAALMEELKAKMKADQAEKEQLQHDLVQHKRDRANAKQDLATASKIREKEHEQYLADAGDTKKNIDAINGAIPALEKGMGVTGFLQSAAGVNLKRVVANFADVAAPGDREVVMAFLESNKDYAPASGQIVGILKNMKDDMDKNLGGIVSEEESAVKSFNDLKAAKNKEIAAAGEAIESKTARAGKLAVAVVQAKAGIDNATAELEDAQKFAANLVVTCKEKTADWEERSKTRSDEVAAIGEAISVLNDDDALDIFNNTLKKPQAAFNQVGFLQTRVNTKNNALKKAKAALVSMVKSKKMSPALNLLGNTIVSKIKLGEKSGKMDFSKVLKMIDDMTALLKKEQKDDEHHKDWCNAEFDSSSDEAKDTKAKIASLESTISEVKDSIAQYAQEIADTKDKIAALDKTVAEATEQRKKEHADFTTSSELNTAATQLIFKASNRLQKFYNPALHVKATRRELTREEQIAVNNGAEDPRDSEQGQLIAGTTQTVFIQLHHQSAVAPPVEPETYGAYKNKGQKGNSVVALMGMLTKELEKDQQEAEHEEKTAQKEYQELVSDAQESRAQDTKTITTSESSKAELEGQLDEAKTGHIIASDQLDQVNKYVSDLHGSCDFILAQFEVRREARSNEIDGLANAKSVLSGANYN